MTEKEAWVYLEQLWLNPYTIEMRHIGGTGKVETPYVTIRGRDCFALCLCVNVMDLFNMLDDGIRMPMDQKIEKEMGCQVYLAPKTVEGAKIRASFCRRMADAL